LSSNVWLLYKSCDSNFEVNLSTFKIVTTNETTTLYKQYVLG